MPQRHLPLFPAGVTHITNELAFERRDGKIAYINGHMPVFVHAEDDVATCMIAPFVRIGCGTSS